MMSRVCAVCGKSVANTDVKEHLANNHLGPHYFWFSARKYRTMEPSMRASELRELAGASSWYRVYLDRNGHQPGPADLHALNDTDAVDLTREPHLTAIPPATMYRGLPE